ncbi:MAG: methyltransferase domain-containing protein [Candidatus Obscuribacterales bacterium]|nr:methyltransferase domain-containing protein [Candidatus Obscuribacterales bacterium]
MNRISPCTDWPGSWLESYEYDRQEMFGEVVYKGYTYAYHNRLRHTLEMISSVLPPGGRVLDVAAAQGNFSLLLAEAGYDVTWNDLRAELVDYVKLKYSHGKIQFLPGNVFELSIQKPYDLVLITEIIEHVAHPDEFLAKVATLLKPGGLIVMTTPNGEYLLNTLPKFSDCPDPSVFESVQFKPNSDGHIFLLHQDEVYKFAQASGLRVRDVRLFTTPLTNGFVKTELLLKRMSKESVEKLESLCQTLPFVVRRKLCLHLGAILEKPQSE